LQYHRREINHWKFSNKLSRCNAWNVKKRRRSVVGQFDCNKKSPAETAGLCSCVTKRAATMQPSIFGVIVTVAKILICAAMCAEFSTFHLTSAHDFTEINIPLISKSINEIYSAKKIESESTPVNNFVNLFVRKRKISFCLYLINPVGIDECFLQPIRNSHGKN
jgi:hypothetical protein